MRTDNRFRVHGPAVILALTLLGGCADSAPTSDVAATGPALPASAVEEIARLRGAITVTDPLPGPAVDVDPDAEVWRMTRQELLDRYATSADAGDASAAHVLGRRLAECHRILREDTPEAVLMRYREDLMEIRELEGRPAHDVRLRNAERDLVRRSDAHADCSTVARDQIDRSAHWLEQAAAAGHPLARADYPLLAMAEFETRNDVIRNPTEAKRRQALARGYLEEAVEAGDRGALHTYVNAQSGHGTLYPADPRAAQVYGYVQQLAAQQPRPVDPGMAELEARLDRERAQAGQPTRAEAFRALLRDGPVRYPPDAFSDAEWARILAEGRRIYEDSFRHGVVSP